jgi:plasmid stabilization system protein ParE
MPEPLLKVELTANFLERLESIEAFLTKSAAAFEYDKLLAELRTAIIPNLSRFPHMGRRYLDTPPQSVEAITQLAQLPFGTADKLREYLHEDYLLLYSVSNDVVYLLSIRHHRQLLFDFEPV